MCLWAYSNSAKYNTVLLHVLLPFSLKHSELKSKESPALNTQQKMFGITKYFLPTQLLNKPCALKRKNKTQTKRPFRNQHQKKRKKATFKLDK